MGYHIKTRANTKSLCLGTLEVNIIYPCRLVASKTHWI